MAGEYLITAMLSPQHRYLLLQLSGDPGSAMKSTKPQYCSCSKTLKKNQNGVRCLDCSSTFHIKCSAMSRKELINYRRHESPWYCFSCCMPQFTDSFFENSSGCLDLSAGDCLDVKDSIEGYSENINSYYKSNIKFGHQFRTRWMKYGTCLFETCLTFWL